MGEVGSVMWNIIIHEIKGRQCVWNAGEGVAGSLGEESGLFKERNRVKRFG